LPGVKEWLSRGKVAPLQRNKQALERLVDRKYYGYEDDEEML
jgi:hypothetical protein